MNMQTQISDQVALSFLSQQAASIESQVYAIKYEDIDYPNLIDIDTTASPFAKTVEFYSMDHIGRAEWFDEKARDVPLANTSRTKHTHSIHMASIGYGYDNWTIGYAQRLGVNLQADDAMSARRSYEEFIDDLVKVGSSDKGMTGLYNDASVTAGNVAGADATARLWSSKTGLQMLDDMNEAVTSIMTTTLRVERPNRLLLPVSRFRAAATKLLGADNASGMTVLSTFRQQNPDIEVLTMGGLETAGASGVARMVAYRKGMDTAKLHLPLALQFLEPMRVGPLLYHVPGVFRTGGVEIRLPGAFRYRDGI